MRSVPRRGTRVRVSQDAETFAGQCGTADGYVTMAGTRHVRVRLHDERGAWVQTIYVPPAELDREDAPR